MATPTVLWPFTHAQVISQVPDQNALYVALRDGQMLAAPVQILLPGPADALRIKQPPMPSRGTIGVVLFLNNDIRNGVWLGSLPGGIYDALSSPADSPFLDYESHWSGFWRSLDASGNTTTTWPDGSQAIVGSAFAPTKHIQDASTGQRVSVARTASDYPAPPAPLPMAINHKSGSKVTISSAGAVEVSAVAGQTITLTSNSATIQIDSSGNVLLTSPATIKATAPTIQLGNGGTLQALLTEAALVWMEGHVHSDPQGGTTGVPTTSPPASGSTSIVSAQ